MKGGLWCFWSEWQCWCLAWTEKKRHISPTVPQIVCCLWLSRPMASLWPSRDVYSEEQKKNGICCFSASVLLLSKNSTAIAVHMGEQAFFSFICPHCTWKMHANNFISGAYHQNLESCLVFKFFRWHEQPILQPVLSGPSCFFNKQNVTQAQMMPRKQAGLKYDERLCALPIPSVDVLRINFGALEYHAAFEWKYRTAFFGIHFNPLPVVLRFHFRHPVSLVSACRAAVANTNTVPFFWYNTQWWTWLVCRSCLANVCDVQNRFC